MHSRFPARRLFAGALSLTLVLMALVVPAGCGAPAPPPTPAPAPSPTATLPAPTPTPAAPQPSAADITLPGPAVPLKAYEVKPSAQGNWPALIVIHENRGLTEHMRDVARRFAAQGYVALAVDLLSRVGGREKFATDAEAVTAIGGLSREGVVEDLQASFAYVSNRPYVKTDRIGIIGYCWGGGNSLLASTRIRGLRAAVVYYGPNPANLDDVANIEGPVLGLYGELDPRITVNVPALAEAMKKYNKSFEYKVYPGAMHAFFNDTGANYNVPAAEDAWKVTLEFLAKNLKS